MTMAGLPPIKRKFTLKKWLLLIFMFSFVIPGSGAHAGIVNGGFENGLTGYYVYPESNGTYGIYQTIGNGLITPTEGSNFLYISTGPGDVANDLWPEAVWISSNQFTIPAGTHYISLDFNILTEQADGLPPQWFYDTAEISCYGLIASTNTANNDLQYRNDTLSSNLNYVGNAYQLINGAEGVTTPSGEHYTKQTGWFTAYLDVSNLTGTSKSFLFSVLDGYFNYDSDTALLVDNIRLISESIPPSHAPIPPSILLLASSLLLAVGLKKEFKKNNLFK